MLEARQGVGQTVCSEAREESRQTEREREREYPRVENIYNTYKALYLYRMTVPVLWLSILAVTNECTTVAKPGFIVYSFWKA